MIPFQAAHGNNPLELLRSQWFRPSVNRKGQMAVFPANAEAEDLLQVQEARRDLFPFFIVDGFHCTPLVLGLIEPAVRIIEDDFPCRGASQDLGSTVRR